MLTIIGLALTVMFFATLYSRIKLAKTTNNTIGFLFNPLLYLVTFSYLYLVLGSLLAVPGQALIGFTFDPEASETASWICYYFFSVFILVYQFNKDKYLRLLKFESGILGIISIFTLLFIVPLSYKALLTYGPALAALQSMRVDAMNFYQDAFLRDSAYGPLSSLALMACTFFMFQYPHQKRSKILFVIVIFPFVAADFLQNGRGVITSAFLLFYILYNALNGKLYIAPAVIFVVLISFFGIVFRMDYKTLDFGNQALGATSEFYLTRSSLDYLINNNQTFTLYDLLNSSISRMLPGRIGEALNINYISYTAYVQNSMKLSFGLAGNIASESYFYGGIVFCMVSPLIIATFYALLHNSRMKLNMAGFIFMLFVIILTQNMMRTSFYESISLLLSFFLTFGLYVIIFGVRIRVLAEYDPYAEYDDEELPDEQA